MTGLALGAIYVLSALGLSLIFGMLNIVSFAHGAFFMVGAYVGAVGLTHTGSFALAVMSAFAAGYGIGALSERLLVRRLYGQGINYPLLLTFGLAYVLVDVVRMIFGREGTTVATPAVLRGAIDLGFGTFPIYRVFLIVFTACLLSITWFAIERTNWGLIIRARVARFLHFANPWHRRLACLAYHIRPRNRACRPGRNSCRPDP